MQISPLGVLLIGREAQASGGLPTPVVSVKFKDGTIEEMMSELSFDTDGDGGTVIGGGGVVISNDPLSGPLVIRSEGTAAYHPSAGRFKGFTSTCNSVRYSSCRFVSFISIWYSSSGTPQSSYPDSCMRDTNWENTSVILCS